MIFNFPNLVNKSIPLEKIISSKNNNPELDNQVSLICDDILNKFSEDVKQSSFNKEKSEWAICRSNLLQYEPYVNSLIKHKITKLSQLINKEIIKDKDINLMYCSVLELRSFANQIIVEANENLKGQNNNIQNIVKEASKLFPYALQYLECELASCLLNLLITHGQINDVQSFLWSQLQELHSGPNFAHRLAKMQLRLKYDSLLPEEFSTELYTKNPCAIKVFKELQQFKRKTLKNGKTPSIDDIKNDLQAATTKTIDEKYVQYKGHVNQFFDLVTAQKGIFDSMNVTNQALALLPQALQHGEFETATWLVKILSRLNKTTETIGVLETEKKNWTETANRSIQASSLNWLLEYARNLPRLSKLEKEDLDLFALKLGFGYKTANLHFMQQQLKKIQPLLKHCGVNVPSIVEVSDIQIRQYLSTVIDFKEIEELWKLFLASFDGDKKHEFTNAGSIQTAKQVNLLPTNAGLDILKQIQDKLSCAFKEQLFYSPIIAEWLNSNPSDFVIVRSTGREDSDSNANAGGNASIPFVTSQSKNISIAIGQVIASYFGEKSIKQRLQAGDRALFTESPFLPVLIQSMVCEKNMGGIGSKLFDIPLSGVLFTREQGKADVIVINASFGSNEGIVSSQVPVDTYLAYENGIYRIIRQKGTRFVQQTTESGEIIVGPVSNDSQLTQRPALSDLMIEDLRTVANALASIYGDNSMKCMDMEYIIVFDKDEKPTINLLQIRPLMNTQQSFTPSFINLKALEDVPQDKKAKVKVLMSGSPYVHQIIDYSKQVIFSDDLPKALHEYQDPLRNAHDVRLIVVRKTAPLTSHESVTFRPTNIPIFVIEDSETAAKVQNLFSKASIVNPIHACPQRGIISEETPKMIEEGLIAYPGTPEYSVLSTLNEEPIKQADKIIKLLETAREYLSRNNLEIYNKLSAIDKQKIEKLTTFGLFDFMAMETDPLLAQAALLRLLKVLHRDMEEMVGRSLGHSGMAQERLKTMIKDPLFNLIIAPLSEVFEHTYNIATKDVLPAFKKHPAQSMNRLFYLKTLQALVMQESSEDVVAGHSFCVLRKKWKTITKELNNQCDTLNIPRSNDNYYLLIMKEAAISERVWNKWDRLIEQLNLPDEKENLKIILEMTKTLHQLNILTPWMNTLFARLYDIDNRTISRLGAVFDKGGLLKNIEEKLTELKQIENQEKCGNWSNPKFVKKNINNFKKIFRNLGFDGDSLSKDYRFATEIGQFSILELCSKAVTIYDSVIKSITGSNLYEDKREKAEHFASLLEGFFLVLETAMNIAGPFEKQLMCLKGFYTDNETSFETYIRYLRDGNPSYTFGHLFDLLSSSGLYLITQQLKVMDDAELSDMFKTSAEFNASAMAIGSHADLTFSAYWPNTLEELFTTAHQSIESIIRFLKMKLGFNHTILPEKTYEFTNICTQCFDNPAGIVTQDKTIDVYYQIPLRQHAASVVVKLPRKNTNQPIQLTVSAFGNEEHDRWKHVATFGAILVSQFKDVRFANDVPPSINFSNPKEVSFTVEIPVQSSQLDFHKNIIESINVLLKITTMDIPNSIDAINDTHVRLVQAFQHEPKYQPFNLNTDKAWIHLHPSFYSNSLLMNLFAMNVADSAQEYGILAKIAENTLRALIQYKMEDYFIVELEATGLIDYYYKRVFPKHENFPSSFAQSAILYMIKACEMNPELLPRIKNEVLNDNVLNHHFPKLMQICSFELKSLQEKCKIFLHDSRNLYKIFIYSRLENESNEKREEGEIFGKLEQEALFKLGRYIQEGAVEDLKQFITAFTKETFNDVNHLFMQVTRALIDFVDTDSKFECMLNALYQSANEDDEILSGILKIYSYLKMAPSNDWENKFQILGKLEKRKTARDSIRLSKVSKKLCEKLHDLKNISSPEIILKSLIDLCPFAEQSIIGLLHTYEPEKQKVSDTSSALTRNTVIASYYFGNPNYGYFYNNCFTETRRIHTIASFVIVYLLENNDTRKLGFEILGRLIDDFMTFGYKNPGAVFVKQILFNLTIALINRIASEDPESHSDLSHKYLFALWIKHPQVLKELLSYIIDTNKHTNNDIFLPIDPSSSIQKLPLEVESGHKIFTGPAPLLSLNEITAEKITRVVMLLDKRDKEANTLLTAYRENKINVIHFPIKDRSVPYSLEATYNLVKNIINSLKTENVFIHCLAGKGRTGTIAACVTAVLNPTMTTEGVIKFTREAIDNSIETPAQEEFVRAFVETYTNKK